MPTNAVTLDDFTTGIIAGLTLAGEKTFMLEDMSIRLIEAFKILDSQPTSTCQLRFHLEPSLVRGKLHSSRIALERAIHRKVLSQEQKQVTIKMSVQEAEVVLRKMPFTPEFWRQLAVTCR